MDEVQGRGERIPLLDARLVHPEGEVAGDLHLRLLAHATPDTALGTLTSLERFPAGVEAGLESLRLAQRAGSRAASLQARYAAKLAKLEVFTAADRHGSVNVVSEEIGMTLGVSRRHAEKLVKVGLATASGPLVETGEALHAGDIAFEVAWAFVETLAPLALAVALAVESAVLPTAPGRTPTEVRTDIARALAELDPDDADERHARAKRSRCVTRPQSLPDGMARVSAFLPASDAVALDAALDASAAAAHAVGDARSASQLRADTLAAWAITALHDGTNVTTDSGGVVRSIPTRVAVTIPLEVMMRAIPGFTPPESVAGVLAEELHGSPETAGWPETAGSPVTGGPDEGHRTEAPWLEGYGPITPAIALLLAQGGTWQRIVTDTLTGLPLDIGRERYSPPANIATAVRLRDRVCVRPGCSVPASRSERDHVHDWALGGVTSADGLASECKRDHRTRTLGLARPGPLLPDGTRTWSTVTGRTYTSPPSRAPRRRGSGRGPEPSPSRDGPGGASPDGHCSHGDRGWGARSGADAGDHEDPPPF